MTTESGAPAPGKRGRKKGACKTGGRKKGTPNRNSMTVLAALDKAGVPVVAHLVDDIRMLAEAKDRIAEWKALMAFCYPRLKEVEFTPQDAPGTTPPAAAGPSAEGRSTSELVDLAKRRREQKGSA